MPLVDFEARCRAVGAINPFETIDLWPHQIFARWQAIKNKRVILSMDKGTGKTLTILSIFEDPEIHQDTPGFTVLILCPEKGMNSYVRDIQKFPEHAEKIQLVYGNKAQRERLWRNSSARYFICTYDSFLSDTGHRDSKHAEGRRIIAPKWAVDNSIDGVVFDEFHRKFRRHRSKSFETFAKLFKDTQYVFPMSGSAISKGPQDLYAALHIVAPKVFSSYWKYVATWCEMYDGPFGKQIGGPKLDRVEKWREVVRPYVVHITADMIQGMPEKIRDFLDVEMDPQQRSLYYQIRDQSFAELDDGEFIFAGNTLTKINLFRNILICPKVVGEQYGVGEGIQAIWNDVQDGGINRFAVFVPFRAPIPILAGWLRSQGARVWELYGGVGLDEQTRRLNAWRASLASATPENPSVVLSTIKYAESWEVPEGHYGYFLGEEWDPEDNKQAEDRLRRLISMGITYIRYCRFLGTYQEEIINLLLTKSFNVRAMLQSWQHLKQLFLGSHESSTRNQ